MCILVFTFSLTRAIHLGLLQNQSAQEFIMALKQLIAKRGKGICYLFRQRKNFCCSVNVDRQNQQKLKEARVLH